MLAKQIKRWDLSKIGGHNLKTVRMMLLVLGVNCISLSNHIHEYRLIFIVFGVALLSLYVITG